MIQRYLTLATCLLPTIGSAADIVFQPQATPSATIMRLGDVATITAPDAALAERMRSLPLGPTPTPGTSQHVSAQAIRELLQAVGESLADHRFAGAISVEVFGPKAPSQPFAVEAKPEEDPLRHWRPAETNEAPRPKTAIGFRGGSRRAPAVRRMTARRRDESIAALLAEVNRSATHAGLPATLRAVRFEGSRFDETTLRGLAGAEATLANPRAIVADRPATVRLASRDVAVDALVVFRELPMVAYAAAPMRRGDLIAAANVELRPADAASPAASRGVFSTLEQVVGLEVGRSLRVGEPLSRANCVGPLMVRRNSPVVVSSGAPGVVITIRGVARQDGRRGDLVSVQLEDRRQLDARVVGPGRLAVLGARPDANFTASNPAGGWR